MNTDSEISSVPAPEHPMWHPPSYHVTGASSPLLQSHTTLEHDPSLPDNFARTAKWCADGSSFIVQCENRTFQTFTMCEPTLSRNSPSRPPMHAGTFWQAAPIVDFVWYPGASRHSLPSYCFVASIRDCPIKLLDGTDGRLRASYPIIDHRERYIAPHSLAFNLTTDKLYCGFEDAIEVFHVQRPGEGERISTTPSKKSKDGLKGIVSTLAFSYSPNYYAAGSLSPASHVSDNIALFDEMVLEPVLAIGGVAEWEKGGVTQLMFNPTQPHLLYAAFRRSERLWNWDLRGDPSVPFSCFSGPVARSGCSNEGLTNQKRLFDIENTGKWLAFGNQCGEIMLYDVEVKNGEPNDDIGEGIRQIRPSLVYNAHSDAIGTVAFHPAQPVLLSVSGSRHFDDVNPEVNAHDDSESDSEGNDGANEDDDIVRIRERPLPTVRDSSIKVWDFNGSEET